MPKYFEKIYSNAINTWRWTIFKKKNFSFVLVPPALQLLSESLHNLAFVPLKGDGLSYLTKKSIYFFIHFFIAVAMM